MNYIHYDDLNRECSKRYPGEDCDSELTYTDYEHIERLSGDYRYSIRRIIAKQGLSVKPSYEVQNHAQIDPVDFVTYIFGAAGTWFGFSFMTIKPVRCIEVLTDYVKRRKRVGAKIEETDDSNQIKSLIERLDTFDDHMNQLRNEMRLTAYSVNRMNDAMMENSLKVDSKLVEIQNKIDSQS